MELKTINRRKNILYSFHSSKMPYTHRRMCPICGKHDLLKLSEHLRQVHDLSCDDRQLYLRNATFFQSNSPSVNALGCMETEPYPKFQFYHPFSMMVVGPTQSGKSYFVEQLLSSKRINYHCRKTKRIHWFYTQWQPLYERLQSRLGKSIKFTQGLPIVDDNLEDINDEVHNLWVFDDLMDEAVQSPVISQLFTRGRHRNLSTILLLQNMFPKGKFNTNISRNALYMILFRSPSDRKQMDMMAERTFAKDRPKFMSAYTKETEKPYGYIILDNHPKTASEKQVIANVFGNCYTYPNITNSVQSVPKITHVQPTVTHEVESSKQPVKRKADSEKTPAKKVKTQTAKKPKKTLPKTQMKPKKARKAAIYKPKFIPSPPRESFTEEEQIDSDEEQFDFDEEQLDSNEEQFDFDEEQLDSNEEQFDSDEEPRDFMTELNLIAKQDYLARHQRSGFGPKTMYD